MRRLGEVFSLQLLSSTQATMIVLPDLENKRK